MRLPESHPCYQRAELWEQRDRRKSREGSGERAQVASEFQNPWLNLRSRRSRAAFSLVELTLAMGVAAFCLLAVFGLMPVGVQTNRNATSQTMATSITAAVIADLRATPKTAGTWTGTSSQFCIPLGTPRKLFFDSQGQCSSDLAGTTSPCGVAWVPALQTRYRLNITFPTTGNLTYAQLKVTWPAAADPATTTPSGSVETFAAFNRN